VEKGGTQTAELASFGWWFSSGKFEDAWALNQLTEALKLSKLTRPNYHVLRRLAKVTEKFPFEAISCLSILLDKDVGIRLQFNAWPEDIRAVPSLSDPQQ